MRDVEVERELHARVPPLSDAEQALWVLDATINRRGFCVDLELAAAARKITRQALAAANAEIAELTGGRVTSIGQVERLRALLAERGHTVKTLSKRSVAAVLAHAPDADVTRLLTLRQEGGKASANKLDALLSMANAGRLHGTMQFHGAATGRWSGRGFQPQNLSRAQPENPDAAIAAVLSGKLERVRAIGPPLEIIGSLSRAMICAAPGHELIGADYSAIELRVLAWIAGETWKLQNYRDFDRTGDPALEPYCTTASRIFGRTVTPKSSEDRRTGKICDLAFGYGGGLGAFRRMAPEGVDFTDAQIEAFKVQWRSAHPKTCGFWRALHSTLRRVLATGMPAAFKNLAAELRAGTLYLRLPGGRELAYPQAQLRPGLYEAEIVFKDNAKGKWADVRGWHGTFVENVVQAISRDLLAGAMQRLEAAGYGVVLHVHDEIIAEVPKSFGSPEEFASVMTALPPWAEGLPLVAEASRRMRFAEDAPAATIAEISPIRRRARRRAARLPDRASVRDRHVRNFGAGHPSRH